MGHYQSGHKVLRAVYQPGSEACSLTLSCQCSTQMCVLQKQRLPFRQLDKNLLTSKAVVYGTAYTLVTCRCNLRAPKAEASRVAASVAHSASDSTHVFCTRTWEDSVMTASGLANMRRALPTVLLPLTVQKSSKSSSLRLAATVSANWQYKGGAE